MANHLATVSGLAGSVLASAGADLGGPKDPRRIVKEQTMVAVLAQFDDLAQKGMAQLAQTLDQSFKQDRQASQQGKVLFSGTRYSAYRNIAINHMIHHRAQLGGYLRSLNVPVPRAKAAKPTTNQTAGLKYGVKIYRPFVISLGEPLTQGERRSPDDPKVWQRIM